MSEEHSTRTLVIETASAPAARPQQADQNSAVASLVGDTAEPNTKRAMILYALGAAIGLAAAGYALLNARGTVTRSVPAEDIALVNQQPILRSDFITQLETETGMPVERTSRQDRLRVLDEMVNEEIKVQRGLELNFAETDQDTRNALSNVVDQEMVANVVISRPSERELLDYYHSHNSAYYSAGTMTVCDLVLTAGTGDSMQRAQAAAEALRAGTSLPQVSKRYGLLNKNSCEENFYFAHKIHLGDRLYAIATGLASGRISEPIRLADGVHVLQMVRNESPVPLSFDDARDQLTTDYKTYRETLIRTGTMNFLRHRAKILIAEDYQDYQVDRSHP